MLLQKHVGGFAGFSPSEPGEKRRFSLGLLVPAPAAGDGCVHLRQEPVTS